MHCCDLEVYTHDGFIIISQERKGEDPEYVQVSPEQVKLLCKWLKGAAENLSDIDLGAVI